MHTTSSASMFFNKVEACCCAVFDVEAEPSLVSYQRGFLVGTIAFLTERENGKQTKSDATTGKVVFQLHFVVFQLLNLQKGMNHNSGNMNSSGGICHAVHGL